MDVRSVTGVDTGRICLNISVVNILSADIILRRYFRPLETEEAGLCMVCSEIQKIADGKPGNGMETGDSKKYEHI